MWLEKDEKDGVSGKNRKENKHQDLPRIISVKTIIHT
jgi:hypothetical protein